MTNSRSRHILALLAFVAVCGLRSASYGDDLAAFADKIGRKTLTMARTHHRDYPVITEAVKIRPEGEIVHGYSRLKWYSKYRKKPYTSEIHWSMTDRPGKRRIFRLIYNDDHWSPCRVHHHNEFYLKKLNHEIFKQELVDGGIDFDFAPLMWSSASAKPGSCCNCHARNQTSDFSLGRTDSPLTNAAIQ